MAEKKNSHYLSGKEVRAIAKENRKIMNALEKRKHRRAEESEFTTEMKDPANILEIEDLHTYFFTDQGVVKAVNGVSFNVPKNATVGVVGESGCGKSVTSMSVMQLLQGPQGQIVSGAIRFNSHDFKRDSHGNLISTGEADHNGTPLFEMEDKVFDIANMPIHEIHRIRGRQIAMIFQEPMTSLNPVFTIGEQLDEVTFIHVPGATKEMAQARSMEMLSLVGIAAPERVYKAFPPRAVGRYAPARHDLHGSGLQPPPHHRRRAYHGSGRDHSGADPGSLARPEGQDGRLHPAHHPRSGCHRRDGRLRGGHVRGPRH